jgi:cell division septal protein FtsQ
VTASDDAMMVEERIAQRRAAVRNERRRARLRRTLLVLLLLVLVGAAIWFERSAYAAVREVTVVGAVRLTESEVIDASGIVIGGSAVRSLPPRIVRDVEKLTLVRSARLVRAGLGRFTIVVEERPPVYSATFRDVSVLVDRDGIIIDSGSDPRLPVVRLATRPPAPGELVVAHAALANAHRAWTGLSGPLRSRVIELIARDIDGLELVLLDGPTVRFGRAELLEEKVRAMGAILDDAAGSGITMLDVRVPGFPVVRID